MELLNPQPEIQTFDGPREITSDNVQFWCRHTKELAKSQVSKALKFVKYDCIRYLGKAFENLEGFKHLAKLYPGAKHIFVCLPLNTRETHEFLGLELRKKPYLTDYNSSEYIIFKRPDGTFECNGQGWQSKASKGDIIPEGANCSHVLALYFAFKMKIFGAGEGAEAKDLEIDGVDKE